MKGFLVLETGELFEGLWLGGMERAGEVVFNTSHSGYEEIATDPSYFSQIVVMTAPMQGNYGADKKVWESRQLWIQGFVCLQMHQSKRDCSWLERLSEQKIPTLSEVDTRSLVKRLREQGTSWGALVQATDEKSALEKSKELIQKQQKLDSDWVHLTSRPEPVTYAGKKQNGPKVAVLDLGSKENILRELSHYASELKIFPSRSSAKEILAYQPGALMLTNGPGDPSHVQVAVETVKELIGKLPIMGICMGHQILGLALGGKTYQLKFGHRGSNHPIQDKLLGQIYMTSQNHGYAVEAQSLPEDIVVTHTNLNDGTLAGFYSKKRQLLGIQFHPESHPGPHEAQALFGFFMEQVCEKSNKL